MMNKIISNRRLGDWHKFGVSFGHPNILLFQPNCVTSFSNVSEYVFLVAPWVQVPHAECRIVKIDNTKLVVALS